MILQVLLPRKLAGTHFALKSALTKVNNPDVGVQVARLLKGAVALGTRVSMLHRLSELTGGTSKRLRHEFVIVGVQHERHAVLPRTLAVEELRQVARRVQLGGTHLVAEGLRRLFVAEDEHVVVAEYMTIHSIRHLVEGVALLAADGGIAGETNTR